MLSLPELRRALRETLVQNLPEALKDLRAALPETADKYQQVIALQGRLSDANKARMFNTISPDDYQLRIDTIRHDCLQLINGLEEADFAPPAAAGKDSKSRHGSVLYRVPNRMPLRKPSICTIRVAIEEDAIFEDIEIDDDVRMRRRVEVSDMMRAELLDPAGEVFSIRPLNEAEQWVRGEGYTQWLFSVTPNAEGEHQLLVKISMLEYNAQLNRYVPRDVSVLENVTIVTETTVSDEGDEPTFKSTGERLALSPAAESAATPQPAARPARRAPSAALRAMAFFLIFLLFGSTASWALTPPPTRDWLVTRYVKDNEPAYQAYIKKWEHKRVARVEDAYFRKAEINPVLSNLREYQQAYPAGKAEYRVAVVEKIKTLELKALERLRAQPEAAAIRRFVQDFPDSERLPELRAAAAGRPDLLPVVEEAYVASIQAQPSATKVADFLRNFPQSTRLDTVRAAAAARPEVLKAVQPALEDAYLTRLERAPTAQQVQDFRTRFPEPAQQKRLEKVLAEKQAAEPRASKSVPSRRVKPEATEKVRPDTTEYKAPVEESPRDTDGDGIPDAADECPAEKGVAAHQGCPAPPEPVEEEIKTEDKKVVEELLIGKEDREVGDELPPVLNDSTQEVSEEPPADRGKSGLTLVRVPGGTFTMGCQDGRDSECENYEKPAHTVTLSGFLIGKYEVTQADWRSVTGENPSDFSGCDDCPVENVSWNDIQDFLKKLNAREPGKNYRLPTEAEWEYAARGGSKSKGYPYAGGKNLDKVAWYGGNAGSKTHPVGGKAPNKLGLYDMSGNVYEWCSDWYGDYSATAQNDPRGSDRGEYRVLRGGSWGSDAGFCRVSRRSDGTPDDRDGYLGFRLVASPSR